MHCVSGLTTPPARPAHWLSASSCILVAAVLFAGCTHSSPAPKSEHPTLAATPAAPNTARAKWRVCTTGDYAPFSTRDAGGQLQGFDIDIARALAEDSGAELEWVSVRW